ncbi:unnamed protein product [Amoebophrya sp. A120]|nr:unnamed protein product [Amoebophrya sp. A120]|eukprot:GSA120T00014202001.1
MAAQDTFVVQPRADRMTFMTRAGLMKTPAVAPGLVSTAASAGQYEIRIGPPIQWNGPRCFSFVANAPAYRAHCSSGDGGQFIRLTRIMRNVEAPASCLGAGALFIYKNCAAYSRPLAPPVFIYLNLTALLFWFSFCKRRGPLFS